MLTLPGDKVVVVITPADNVGPLGEGIILDVTAGEVVAAAILGVDAAVLALHAL